MSHELRSDWASPPGDTILDWMEENNVDLVDMAGRLGMSQFEFTMLSIGNMDVDISLATRLQKVIGATADFWITRHHNYRIAKARAFCRAEIRMQLQKLIKECDEKVNSAGKKNTPGEKETDTGYASVYESIKESLPRIINGTEEEVE